MLQPFSYLDFSTLLSLHDTSKRRLLQDLYKLVSKKIHYKYTIDFNILRERTDNSKQESLADQM